MVGWLSNNVFLDVSSNLGKFWKKSLNGHETVVGGHATIGRLSNNVFSTFQAIRKKFEKSHWRVTRQWSVVTRLSADCQAHICMHIIINEREREREREREWERESERERERESESERERGRERERPNTTLHLDGESLTKRQKSGKKNLPRQFSRLLTPAPSLSVFHGNLPQEICGASSLVFIMGEREREREGERERDGESTLQDHIIYNEMRIALHMCLPDNFLVCWPPATALSVFHGNLPQEICRLCL